MDEQDGVNTPEANSSASTSGGDDIKNLKSEMSRKMGNLEATNAQLAQQLQALLRSTAPAKPDAKKISVFDDEDAFAETVVAQAERRIDAKLAAQANFQAKQAATIQSLVEDYPELASSSHELTKKAVEIYNSMPEDERVSPVAYKAAVREAATELEIKPMKKRNNESADSYSMGGSSRSTAAPAKKKEVMTDRTEALAEAFGINLKDEKVRERVIKRHARKNYTSWE